MQQLALGIAAVGSRSGSKQDQRPPTLGEGSRRVSSAAKNNGEGSRRTSLAAQRLSGDSMVVGGSGLGTSGRLSRELYLKSPPTTYSSSRSAPIVQRSSISQEVYVYIYIYIYIYI